MDVNGKVVYVVKTLCTMLKVETDSLENQHFNICYKL